jgi:hypothetical protein
LMHIINLQSLDAVRRMRYAYPPYENQVSAR